MRNLTYAALLALIGWGMSPASAAPPAALYQKHCAACHEGGVPRAPHSVKFQMIGT
jgi:cytochrome c5